MSFYSFLCSWDFATKIKIIFIALLYVLVCSRVGEHAHACGQRTSPGVGPLCPWCRFQGSEGLLAWQQAPFPFLRALRPVSLNPSSPQETPIKVGPGSRLHSSGERKETQRSAGDGAPDAPAGETVLSLFPGSSPAQWVCVSWSNRLDYL